VGGTTLQSLVEATKKYDFAVFVFRPDDGISIRNKSLKSVRRSRTIRTVRNSAYLDGERLRPVVRRQARQQP
jgi:hypothetical protein